MSVWSPSQLPWVRGAVTMDKLPADLQACIWNSWRIHADMGTTCKLLIERPFLKERFTERTFLLWSDCALNSGRYCPYSEMQHAEAVVPNGEVHWSLLTFLGNNELIYIYSWALMFREECVAVAVHSEEWAGSSGWTISVLLFEPQQFNLSG